MDVVGVRFKEIGKIYYFSSNNKKFLYKQKVVVETDNGLDIGEVILTNFEIDEKKI